MGGPTAEATGRRGRRRRWVVPTVIALLVALVGGGIAALTLTDDETDEALTSAGTTVTTTAGPKTIFGGMVVGPSTSVKRSGDICYTTGGYSDIKIGTPVTVKDAAGTIIGVSELIPGGIPGAGQCRFAFYLRQVPMTDIYQIEVGRRGALPYKRADLDSMNWTVEFTLG